MVIFFSGQRNSPVPPFYRRVYHIFVMQNITSSYWQLHIAMHRSLNPETHTDKINRGNAAWRVAESKRNVK
uniref:Uncharacterized protein n=1 Tax=Setaria italica TaxID=4555 RepID=K3YXE2_SETIT